MRVIYKITNLINQKIYIGKHSNHRESYMGSGVAIKKAISKYGLESFKKEIIDNADSLQELNDKEVYWIAFFKSTDPAIGYNRSGGGTCDWGSLTDEVREKARIKQKKTMGSKEFKEKRKEIMKKFYEDPTNREKRSIKQKEVWNNTAEERKKEIREKRSASHSKNWNDDPVRRENQRTLWKTKNPMHNPETKANISAKRKGKNNPAAKKIEVDGKVFFCIKDACTELNLTMNQMAYRLRTHKNYKRL
jgi:hypothetical protein